MDSFPTGVEKHVTFGSLAPGRKEEAGGGVLPDRGKIKCHGGGKMKYKTAVRGRYRRVDEEQKMTSKQKILR